MTGTLGPRHRTWAIFLISLAGLYLEMMLIRWVATEVRVFAYLQNTVLVVCFLGLGMGCFTCQDAPRPNFTLGLLLLLTTLFAIPPVRHMLGEVGAMLGALDVAIWYPEASTLNPLMKIALGVGLTFLMMLLLWEMFVPIGRLLGRLMHDHPHTLWAYSANVAGSLAGTWLFVAVSAWQLRPVAWVAIFAVVFVPFLERETWRRVIGLVMLAASVGFGYFAGLDPGYREVHWSPYQKLTLGGNDELVILVNNAGYQVLKDLRPEHLAKDPDKYPPDFIGYCQYDLPCRLHSNPRDVLVVGAGAGNDVAGMLRNGAGHVTAVEIDPVILDIGRRLHPERPYDSDRVTLVTDDARAFFARCRDKFDVISFGLLDSHTSGAMTNARLDHFVYTRESLRQVRSLLKPHGIVILSFEVNKPFIADRMARVLRDEFGEEPFVFFISYSNFGWGGVHFVAGDLDEMKRQIESQPTLAKMLEQTRRVDPVRLNYATPVATDDWPYIYLERPRVPGVFVLLAAMIGGLFMWGRWRFGRRVMLATWSRDEWHFLLLGAAFMLLEAANITRAAAVLGSTWSVNAVIVSGVLAMILIANFVTARFPRLPMRGVAALLCLSCLGLYSLDFGRFSGLPYSARAALVGCLAALPMLFSGILFARTFVAASRKELALGANLIGALAGGLLQTLTFLTGIKAMLLLVTLLYAVAYFVRPADANGGNLRRR